MDEVTGEYPVPTFRYDCLELRGDLDSQVGGLTVLFGLDDFLNLFHTQQCNKI